jgi:sugar phosphate isomerase/epimerase
MKIALNTYSLRKEWENMTTGGNYGPVVKLLKMLPEIKEVELLDNTFKSDPTILKQQIKVLGDVGLKVFSLGPHVCPLRSEQMRESTIADFKKWTDIAADNGVFNYRVALSGGKFEAADSKPQSISEAVEWTLKVLNPAVQYAESRKVNLCIETHHKYSSNPEFQEDLLNTIHSKNLGFIFDIGNFENDELRWKSLDVLIKHKAVKYVHAKAYKFNKKGFETKLDYPKAVKLLHDAGIDINLSIEWEGRLGGPLGVLKSYELCKYSILNAKNQEYQIKTDFPKEKKLMNDIMG